ncbi:MAG: cation-translocating P-type ATPase [Candidatus Peregrinibacteria bacterium]
MSNQSFTETGLTTQEVRSLREKFGYNEFVTKREYKTLKIFLSQFTSFLILILIIAGTISILLNEIVDGIAIFAIVVMNAIIGFIQEYKAENAVKALKKMIVPTAIVIRNSQEMEISVKELVPGDLVLLSEGEKIPADLEIIKSYSLRVDESVLTGESAPVYKKKSKGKEGKLFGGTLITAGRAHARVLSIGMQTEFGKIVNLVSKQSRLSSPLTNQLNNLGKKVGLVILLLVIILFILGTIRGISLIHMLMTSVALGVSAIPEGMPIIVTLTLAMGVQILARKKAIVRKMTAIETLGATTIICSDKTGTLTLNEMTVKIINTSFHEQSIPGVGYDFKKNRIRLATKEEKKLLEICENCNNAFVDREVLGDPTEIALKVLARKAGFVRAYKEIDEIVFTSERKMMSSLHQTGSKKEIMSKGAFEEIIKRCKYIYLNGKIVKLLPSHIKTYQETVEKYAKEALRVLAFAYKPYKDRFDENDMIFVGIVGMMDPPRKTVKSSIRIAQKAGIKIRIITGDNPITAAAVGGQIGLKVNNILTGDQIDKMSDSQLRKALENTEIFARTSPQHKYRIVDILKRQHEVVAVTGDGVNDAPALKHGDVGIAMGIKGTEATKEVADIILKDDNFTTIVNTIEEGRRIYHNILAFIKYMLSANYDSITAVGILTIIGLPLPILPLQILWINIATDALPALALGRSKAAKDIMTAPPHPKEENIFRKFFGFIMVAVIYQTVANLTIYFYGLDIDSASGINTSVLSDPSHARTLVFTQIVMFELLFVFVCKEEKSITLRSFLSNKYLIFATLVSFILQLFMIYTPFMQTVFKTVPLSAKEWLVVMLLACMAFLVPKTTEIIKKIFANGARARQVRH